MKIGIMSDTHGSQEAIRRVLSMVKRQRVTAINGREIVVRADSICLHGDAPKAVLFAEKIQRALQAEGVQIAPLAVVLKEKEAR